MKVRVLIIEDELPIRRSLAQTLSERDYEVIEADSGRSGLDAFDGGVFDLILLDYRLPDMTGLEVLRAIRQMDQDTIVIIMTGYSSIETAVDAIKLGAFNYVTKPFQTGQILHMVEKALETTQLRREVRELRRQMRQEFGMDAIIGRDASMQQLFEVIRQVSRAGLSTVFLRGETGTGKDLVARVIHHNSERAEHPFINITCTALSESLLESELFGHERGAFTDAKLQKKGLFELADGGTAFLDEVGDMPPALQAKLLRFLEERRFRRVGGTEEIRVDVRIMAATNRDLERAIEQGQFRRDLMFRLNVVTIHLPPLRARGDDIDLLTDHFIERFAAEFRKPLTRITDAARARLRGYHWPGNVRELRNVLERAALLCRGDTIDAEDIVLGRSEEQPCACDFERINLPPGGFDLSKLAVLEERLLRQALERTHYNQTQAARLLNLSRDRLRYRLQKHGLL